MKHWTLLCVSGVVVGAMAACGGAEQTSLLDDSGVAPPGKDGSVQLDAGPTPGPDASEKKDAASDAPAMQDTSTVDVQGPADSKIHCGTTTCSAQNQVCCATVGNASISYACVNSLKDCSSGDQFPMTCTSSENCASQGNAGYVCCASPGGPQSPGGLCGQYNTPSQVQCAAACDTNAGEFQVGCNVTTQNCADNAQACIVSKCTLPNYPICQ